MVLKQLTKFTTECDHKNNEQEPKEYDRDSKRRLTLRFRRKGLNKDRNQSEEYKKPETNDKFGNILRKRKFLQPKNLNIKRRSVSLYGSPFMPNKTSSYEFLNRSHESGKNYKIILECHF